MQAPMERIGRLNRDNMEQLTREIRAAAFREVGKELMHYVDMCDWRERMYRLGERLLEGKKP